MRSDVSRRVAALTSAAVLGAGAGGPLLARAVADTIATTSTVASTTTTTAAADTTTTAAADATATDAGTATTPTAPVETTVPGTATATTAATPTAAPATATTTSTVAAATIVTTSGVTTPAGSAPSATPRAAKAGARCRRSHRHPRCRRRARRHHSRSTAASPNGSATSTTTSTSPAPAVPASVTPATAGSASTDSDATVDGAIADVWGTGVGNDDGAIAVLTGLLSGRDTPPRKLVPIYRAAAARYRVPWQVLAAINAVETDYGRDERTSSAGAVGWMQFMPGTWQRYAARRRGTLASPYDPHAAIFAAAKMLAADGARTDLRQAIYAYNHSDAYVAQVLDVAQAIVDRQARPSTTAQGKLTAMRTAAELLRGTPYLWGGGHASWASSAGYDCSGFVSAVLHAAGYLAHPQDTQTLVSARGIENGVGRWVTVFDRTDGAGLDSDHMIIDIDGQWWESGGSSTAGGSADVHRIGHVSATYLATFNRIVHPRGL